MPKAKKNKLAANTNNSPQSPMLQTHGKLETSESQEANAADGESFKPTRLSQILAAADGDYPQDYGYYNTDDAKKYEEYVKAMPRTVLDEHCRKVGFIPSGETTAIVSKLITAFKRHWQSNLKLPAPKTFSKEQADKISKILKGSS